MQPLYDFKDYRKLVGQSLIILKICRRISIWSRGTFGTEMERFAEIVNN